MSHNGANINLKIGMRATGNFSNFNKTMKNAASGVKTFTSKMGAAKKAVVALGTAFAGLTVVHTIVEDFKAISGLEFTNFAGLVEQSIEVSKNFADAEAKLKALLKNTKSITDPAGAATRLINQTATLESSGVVAQEVLESGLQQLSTFQLSEDSLTQLSTGMADLLAQQYGVDATQENAVSVANLIGKGMSGMTGALTRVGIVMDENQKALIQNGDEQTRLNTMVEVLSQNVGGVNQYLAENTAAGKEANFQYQIAGYMREWGDKFSEMRIKILDTIRPYLPILKRIMDAVISVVGAIIDGVAKWVENHGEEFTTYLENIASKIEEFASHITAEWIEEKVTSIIDLITAIVDMLKKLLIIYGVSSAVSFIGSAKNAFSLRSSLPYDLTSIEAMKWLKQTDNAAYLQSFNAMNSMRNAGGAGGTGARLGAWLAKPGTATSTITANAAAAGGQAAGLSTSIASALSNPVTIAAVVIAVASGLNKYINEHFGGGEGFGTWLAGCIVKGIQGIIQFLEKFFGVDNFKDLMVAIFKNAIQFFFETLPEILGSLIKTLALAVYDAFTSSNESGLFTTAGGFGGSVGNGNIGYQNIDQNALGTPYSHGTTTINERGGEIMRLPSGTTIIPADKSADLLSAKGGITVNLNIQGNVLGNEAYMEETCEYLTRKLKMALVAG